MEYGGALAGISGNSLGALTDKNDYRIVLVVVLWAGVHNMFHMWAEGIIINPHTACDLHTATRSGQALQIWRGSFLKASLGLNLRVFSAGFFLLSAHFQVHLVEKSLASSVAAEKPGNTTRELFSVTEPCHVTALRAPRGANLVPMEELEARMSASAYGALVRSAAEAGMNCIRINGVGIFPPRAFFSECDKHGILVYHDMMYQPPHHHPKDTK